LYVGEREKAIGTRLTEKGEGMRSSFKSVSDMFTLKRLTGHGDGNYIEAGLQALVRLVV